jgi:hypothetical protein
MKYSNVLEKLLVESLGNWGLLLIPFIAGIFVSFFAEVFNKITPEKYHGYFWVLVLSIITCVLLFFVFPFYYEKIDAFAILMLLLNIAVSFLFYPLIGKTLVGKIFDKFQEKAGQAIDKV